MFGDSISSSFLKHNDHQSSPSIRKINEITIAHKIRYFFMDFTYLMLQFTAALRVEYIA
jgi:hypothetical protein